MKTKEEEEKEKARENRPTIKEFKKIKMRLACVICGHFHKDNEDCILQNLKNG